MSYAPKGVAPSECDPGWVRWAEGETVSRLQDQLTSLRVQRELRRAAAPDPDAALLEPESSPPADTSGSGNVAAMNAPPAPGDPAWHAWAEAQTVLRLRRPRSETDLPAAVALPDPVPPPAPPRWDPLRVEGRPPRTIRIHHDNLETVRLSESKESV